MEIIRDTIKNPFVNETDSDLLVIISMKEDTVSSNLAFTEFYRRFNHFMFGMAFKVTAKLPNFVEVRDSVFQNTLISIFKYCGSFGTNGETDPAIIKRMIHGWIVKILKNELLTLLRGIEHDDYNEDFSKYLTENVLLESDIDIPTYNEQILENALKLLSSKDQHIFMTYWLYYESGKGSQAKNLPTEILNDLIYQYGTTPENIRQIISRSKKKVFDYLRQNYEIKRK